jgi:hypothetical protein
LTIKLKGITLQKLKHHRIQKDEDATYVTMDKWWISQHKDHSLLKQPGIGIQHVENPKAMKSAKKTWNSRRKNQQSITHQRGPEMILGKIHV